MTKKKMVSVPKVDLQHVIIVAIQVYEREHKQRRDISKQGHPESSWHTCSDWWCTETRERINRLREVAA